MRYSPEHKQQTRQRIVRAAARRFRSSGSSGTGINDLMRDLHLTHGGFYRHFGSKEGLFAEAFGIGLEDVRHRAEGAIERARSGEQLKALIDSYLDIEHGEDAANGCPVAALGAEVARRPRAARAAFERELEEHIHLMARHLPGDARSEREQKAVLLFSGMAGTLTLARVMTDERSRRKLLNDARMFYLRAVRAS